MEDLSPEERKSVVDEGSSIVLSLLKRECVSAPCQVPSERVRRLAERALQKGLECSRRATHKWLCQALQGGAGPAHRWCGKEDALPELPLVIRDRQGNFTADPQCVAELHAQEWKREWGNEDAIGFSKEKYSIRALREKHVAEARVWANSLGLRAVDIRKACLSFPSKTAIGLDQHAFTDIANFTDNALGETDNVLSSWPYQLSHCCNFWSCWAGKMEGAEPSPSCTQHTVSPCAWYQHTSFNGCQVCR